MEHIDEIMHDLEFEITADKVLLFDLDGTLVDTNLANFLSYCKAIRTITKTEFDLSFNPHQRFTRKVLKNSIPNLSEDVYKKIVGEKERIYQDFLPETKLNKKAANILLKYSKSNQTVLVTNCRKDRAMLTLTHYELTDKFDNIFCRQTTDYENKTNKYQTAIKSLNISVQFVIVFENEKTEIHNAIIAGISNNYILSF